MSEDPEVISTYSDRQAVEDGVLIPMAGLGPVNRVTRAVFAHFVGEAAFEPTEAIDIPKALEPLTAAICAMLSVPFDKDGWRTGDYDGRRLWLVPNEVGGLTLMFPEDY
jgi:hypothetical protein